MVAQPSAGPATPRSTQTSWSADAGLVSGEAVELDIRVARVGSRALALMVDIIAQFVLALVLLIVGSVTLAVVRVPIDPPLLRGLLTLGLVAVLLGYPVLIETWTGGRTLGKLVVGLRVVRDDGGPVRFRHALARGLVGVAIEWPGLLLPPLTWVASLTTMMGSPRGRRLGDLAAGTLVIHDRSPASWGWVPGMPPALAGWASTLDLTGLTDDLALAVRHFLARSRGFAEPARSRLGQGLAREVAATTTPPPPPGVPGWAYLAAVLAERHRRAAHRLARVRSVNAVLWPDLGASAQVRREAGRAAPVGHVDRSPSD